MSVREQLWEVASDMFGYVTPRHALELGISRPAFDMFAARGNLERAAHGVYRFPEYPVTDRDHYMLAVLWTGRPEACLSHDTALAVREVSDLNPDRVHVTVGAGRRIRRSGGDLYVVHYADLRPEQHAWWEGVPSVTLPTAIEQCIQSGVPAYLLSQALDAGARTGALLPDEADQLAERLAGRL